MSSDNPGKLDKKLQKLGIPRIRRHILLCCDTDETGCASKEQMNDAWKHLKRRLRNAGLAKAGVFRSKSQCFDVCRDGPIAVVYPEGTWYGRCTPANIDRIVDEHIIGGRVVDDLAIARPPLCAGCQPIAGDD